MMRELKITQSITVRDTASLNKYMTEIGKIPLLNDDDEIRLARKAKEGDTIAREKLVQTNLRFVVSVAKKYQNRGLSLGDLINEGNLGLIKAASKFDETKGFKFISFAVWWIRQSIMLAIAEQTRTIRLPLNVINAITKINRTVLLLEQELERNPTAQEVADKLHIESRRISYFQHKSRKSMSLDKVANQEIGSTLLDVIPDSHPSPDYLVDLESYRQEVGNILTVISKREGKILCLYFGLGDRMPLSLDDIALLFGLSRERIRQLKDSGLRKLRAKADRIKNRKL